MVLLNKSHILEHNGIQGKQRFRIGFEISMPPRVIFPLFTSQKRAASLETVALPPPEGPIRAVTWPLFCSKGNIIQDFLLSL